ncbi:hypothetical protein MASR1M74_02390 [Lentimicrobium sp.]
MKTNEKLRLRIAFDVLNGKGESLTGGRHNALEMPLNVGSVSANDVTALHLWLRSMVGGLHTPEHTGHLMPEMATYQDMKARIKPADDAELKKVVQEALAQVLEIAQH